MKLREIKPVVHDDVCACLRDLLERAERGEVIGIMAALALPGNKTATVTMRGGSSDALLLHALERVKFRIMLSPFGTEHD